MAKGFTEQEKITIKKNLQHACRQSWTMHGYKKTGVDELCRQAGISKGAFYLFYASKEALFCEVLCSVQEQMRKEASRILKERPNKHGVAKALKHIYREYDRYHFLCDADSMDFTILKNRLSEEEVRKIEASEQLNRQLFFSHPRLKCKVKEDLALSVLYTLILNIRNKDVLLHNHMETFDFMADHLADSLYE